MLYLWLAMASAQELTPIVRIAPPAPPIMVTNSPPPIIAVGGRIPRPTMYSEPQGAVETIRVRIVSPGGTLWEGGLRVAPNQSASYQQSLSQASPKLCPPGSSYEQADRNQVSLSLYQQFNQNLGAMLRVDASWARPSDGEGCGENGTRTVQINQTVPIAAGETVTIEGDAGLRVQLTRAR